MHLGIEEHGSGVYEGDYYLHALYPTPIVSPVSLIFSGDKPALPPENNSIHIPPLIFREDSFDPTSRIKRGRIYSKHQSQPHRMQVYPHPARSTENSLKRINGETFEKSLFLFESFQENRLIKENRIRQRYVILGTEHSYSMWLVTDVEKLYTEELLFTLRSARSFGMLPILIQDMIPESWRKKIQQSFEVLENELHKASPESVIDRARELLVCVLGSKLEQDGEIASGLDLGALIRKYSTIPDGKQRVVINSAATIVARLHARGKEAEKSKRAQRQIMEQDGELAVSCVGVVLCDLEWGLWQ